MGERLFTDMLGREVRLAGIPRRIVSLVPSQTELLHHLGLEEAVVGITKFCVHPESWFRSKTRVGGTKTVHTDRVAALSPDLILANKEENVQEQIEALSALAPVWVSDIHTLDDALEMIRGIGELCNRETGAAEIAASIAISFEALQPSIPLRRAAYGIWRDPWMWAGGDTFIQDLMQRAGLNNMLSGVPRYPLVSLADLAAYAPEVVLLSSEPYPFRAAHVQEVRAALPGADVLLVDGELFSWYGSRLLQTAPYLKSLILPAHE